MGTAALPRELDEQRFLATQEQLAGPGKDLADLSDAEFELGLERLKKVQVRIKRLLETALVEGGHYGNPETGNGRKAFKKPILYKAGAEELRRLMRYSLHRVVPDEITVVPPSDAEPLGYVAVVVELGVYDTVGRKLASKRAACTTKEGRFRTFDGKGWIYKDAREKLHDCLSMAEKRAGSQATSEASGATAFLANGEEMEEALDDDRPITPWTDAERAKVREAAQNKGLGRRSFEELVHRTLGRSQIGSGPDVVNILSAIDPAPANGHARGPCEECRGTGRNDADTHACATCTGTGRVRA